MAITKVLTWYLSYSNICKTNAVGIFRLPAKRHPGITDTRLRPERLALAGTHFPKAW